ncbi:GNAT family N-acetyltransferase [Micromonospora sp. RTGN7]|uniref:GNAT family N-acetyltransferase n=1 Tax=Micromonospora sp. RTGN7 TaxID=3016526 RepID=UPI0029FF36A4|nr:GNAT family N-acetyltransferase [Micromonospora sp. RTGN7]
MPLTLAPMTADRFASLRMGLEQSYAENLAEARHLSLEAALATSSLQLAQLLPDGLATPDALLRLALVDGVEVGWIWVTLPRPDGPSMSWIHNIEVYPAHQGRGHAGRMIGLVEVELARLGFDRLGLNVFADNTVAVRLYERLGFRVDAQQMSKRIGPEREPRG